MVMNWINNAVSTPGEYLFVNHACNYRHVRVPVKPVQRYFFLGISIWFLEEKCFARGRKLNKISDMSRFMNGTHMMSDHARRKRIYQASQAWAHLTTAQLRPAHEQHGRDCFQRTFRDPPPLRIILQKL